MSNKDKTRQRILIADDSPTVTGILGFLFGEEGWIVDSAADGVEALRRFYANPPDLVVLDIEMPRMNGYQVCRILKDDLEMTTVPVIILTSRDLQSDRFRGLAAGADAYVVKNIEDDQLLVTVRHFLDNLEHRDFVHPKARQISESEILQAVNRLLDRRLFISTVTAQIDSLNVHIPNFEIVQKEMLALFGAVFEFVVGGMVVAHSGRIDTTVSLLEGFNKELAESFSSELVAHARLNLNTSELEKGQEVRVSHITSGSRQFSPGDTLIDRKFWPLISGGKTFGIIGIAGTSQLKFDLEGTELLTHFLKRAGLVLDNSRLLAETEFAKQKLTEAMVELQSAQLQLIQTEKMASLGQLMAGLAHEMNNPLNFVSGNIDYLEKYSLDLLRTLDSIDSNYKHDNQIIQLLKAIDYDFLKDDMPAMIVDMKIGIDRSRSIIGDLRTFASADQLETSPTDLSNIISSTLNLLKHQWAGLIAVNFDCATNEAVDCHPGQIGQVVLNLISNAIGAIHESGRTEGRIDISLRKEDRWVEISVEDNGGGISDENLGKLFQPFFTTKEVGKGMGLGLSISYGIVSRHHGEILVNSTVGKGSKFVVRLPAIGRGDG